MDTACCLDMWQVILKLVHTAWTRETDERMDGAIFLVTKNLFAYLPNYMPSLLCIQIFVEH
jgi:hypothetical protein